MTSDNGSANAQTRATRKYQAKAGMIAKSYKIKKTLADEFAQVCKERGVSQAAAISEMMQDFIRSRK